jgi:formiminotetrahydrofolate cyclodeaminase
MSNYKNEMAGVRQSETEESRRSFLKKAGKFAVYTPPAVMLLMKPSFAHINKSYCGRPGNVSSNPRNSDIVRSAFFGEHK